MLQFLYFREPPADLTPEERDARTVFCMQLSARIRPRDLEEFFSSVGLVSTVKPVFSDHSKILDKTRVLKTNGSLMKVKSIAEYSSGASCNTSVRPALSDNQS